jgi:general secretion pathway protein K
MNRKLKNNSGIILIVVLWVLVILSMLAIGLSRKVKVDLALTKNSVGKMKSRYAAMAGLAYAMAKIHADSKDPQTNSVDTKVQCGFVLKSEETPESLFKEQPVGEGHFMIGYQIPDADKKRLTRYGLQDEESKINLNALNTNNYQVLKYLIDDAAAADEETSKTVASAVVDWIDADNNVFNSPLGAEKDAYETADAAYPCKNKPFDSIEELMLVKGMTPDIFKKIKNYITVFPRQGNLLVNFETAPATVLKALARNATGPQTNTGLADADSLVERMLAYRQGDDGQWATEDDRVINGNEMGLNGTESAVFQAISYSRTQVSQYLRASIKATDDVSGVSTIIEAVIQRSDLSLLYWRRQ